MSNHMNGVCNVITKILFFPLNYPPDIIISTPLLIFSITFYFSCFTLQWRNYLRYYNLSTHVTMTATMTSLTPLLWRCLPRYYDVTNAAIMTSLNPTSTTKMSLIVFTVTSPLSVGNAIPITSWLDDNDDVELLNILPLLDALRFTRVRRVRGYEGY